MGKEKLDLQRATHLLEELASQWKRPLGQVESAREAPVGEEPAITQSEEIAGEDGSSD